MTVVTKLDFQNGSKKENGFCNIIKYRYSILERIVVSNTGLMLLPITSGKHARSIYIADLPLPLCECIWYCFCECTW